MLPRRKYAKKEATEATLYRDLVLFNFLTFEKNKNSLYFSISNCSPLEKRYAPVASIVKLESCILQTYRTLKEALAN